MLKRSGGGLRKDLFFFTLASPFQSKKKTLVTKSCAIADRLSSGNENYERTWMVIDHLWAFYQPKGKVLRGKSQTETLVRPRLEILLLR